MWLLDANVDVHLVEILREAGIPCDTTAARGWKHLSNGELLSASARAGFSCLLTRDRLFGETASRTLRSLPNFAVIVVSLPQQPWPQYRQRFLDERTRSAIQPIPGRVIFWPKTKE